MSATLRLLATTAAPHRRALVFGTIATFGVVAMRLALPWPLRGVVENVFPPTAPDSSTLAPALDLPGGPVVSFCVIYFLLAVGTGIFEWVQRVWMARTASLTSHDLRSRAVEAVGRGAVPTGFDRADLITRIVGDSARLKADLKGILIHLTQNALLLLAITALFLFLAPRLGLLFLLSGLLAILIGYVTVEEVAETTSRQRRKESKYAATIRLEAWEDATTDSARELNRSSAKKEVRITQIIARSTLAIHAGVAATLGFAFWIGVQDVRAGTLAPGELFLFIAYAITIQRRAVMIGRQVARVGKLRANAQRIGALVDAGGEPAAELPALTTRIGLEQLRVKQPRLGPVSLEIPAGGRVLVLGGDGAGKSGLLRAIAGRARIRDGRLTWDGRAVENSPESLARSVAYLSEQVEFGGVAARWLLALPGGGEPSADEVAILQRIGAWKVVRKFRDGLDQVVESGSLSRRERRALVLGGILLGDAAVWVLDEPIDGVAARDRDRLEAVLDRAEGRTLVLSLRRAVLVERFDRVVVLRKGKIDFEGTASEWLERRQRLREIRRA